ncbi:MAG: hypothetical protein NDF53_02755 [archaeon GB-1867-097]|nr:hypothetical protein [Candidatus Culexmicrobium thermophilum]MCS7384634.1 hypothetical protein [Candidatus Culexmicrobium thermophilum]RLE56170.1 MAG: hypothetical protein DRJ30_02790 [Candidatus Verstraetearchaeota archaeon]HDO19935.1 hypothetical protein [Candidatus Bathyarchaeota archaeon]
MIYNYSLSEKVEALILLLKKAADFSSEVEYRIPVHFNAKSYAIRLRRIIENALILSREILEDLNSSSTNKK